MSRRFSLVDVFAEAPFAGNPLAVVHSGEGLSTQEMQCIAQWLNLSETTFLLPPSEPEADYAVRIFTLERELPFAGHPTLGSAHAWLEAGGHPNSDEHIIQQCGAGLIQIKKEHNRLAFAAPPLLKTGPLDDLKIAKICDVLRIERSAIIDHQWLDNGPGWAGVMLESGEAVRALKPLGSWPQRIDIGIVGPEKVGVLGREKPGGETQWEVRALFSNHTGALIEDPVTGSLNAGIAQWLFNTGRAIGNYVAAQGTSIGRTGRVHASHSENGAIWIGGNCRTLFQGKCEF